MVGRLIEERLVSPAEDADDETDNQHNRQPADILRWSRVADAGNDELLRGKPLQHEGLAGAIAKVGQDVVHFTKSEWDLFNFPEDKVIEEDYIKVDDLCFRPSPPLLKQMVNFSQLCRMSDIGNALVCGFDLGDSTKKECIDGNCVRCGFHRLWSGGLRPRCTNGQTSAMSEIDQSESAISTLWRQEMSWCSLRLAMLV